MILYLTMFISTTHCFFHKLISLFIFLLLHSFQFPRATVTVAKKRYTLQINKYDNDNNEFNVFILLYLPMPSDFNSVVPVMFA